MTERLEPSDDLAEIEALVRDAGGYVGASDDLRPRVLESIRTERRRRAWGRNAALATPAAVLLVAAVVSPLGSASQGLDQASARAQVDQALDRGGQVRRLGADGLVWSVADAFAEVRSRQAAALHRTADDEIPAQIDEDADSE